jgi:biotin carboxylase
MARKAFIVLGAGYGQTPLMRKARERGLSPIAVDHTPEPAGKGHCDLHVPISYRDEAAIHALCMEHDVAGIGTIGTNDAIHVASRLNQRLSLPGLYDDPEVIRSATYKHLWRRILEREGLATPPGDSCESVRDLDSVASEIGFPILLKPADASGARGIRIVDKAEELLSAFRHARRYSSGNTVVVEKFVGHNSIAVESFVVDGKVRLIAVGERKLPPAPLCVGLGVTVPDHLPEEVRSRIAALNRKSIEALGVSYGPVHVDMVVDSDGNPFVIDIGPRLVGGPFGWTHIRQATGFDILEAAFRQAIGEKVRSVNTRSPDLYFSHRYLTTETPGTLRRVVLNEHLFEEHGITSCRLFVKEGDRIEALADAEQRYGVVTASAGSFESVCEKVDAFVDQVRFEVDPFD